MSDEKICQRFLFTVLTAFFLLRLALAWHLNLIPDEAYYWVWSRNLSCCYYEQPGMIAWLTHLSTQVTGISTPLTARLPVALLGIVSTALVFLISRDLFGSNFRALRATTLVNILPLFFDGALLALPDAPLFFFSLLSAFALVRFLATQRPGYLYLTAMALSGAVYSKYTGVLVGLGVCLVFLLSSRRRLWLTNVHIYIAALLTVLLLVPILWWNYQHEWVSYRYVQQMAARAPHSLGELSTHVFSYHGSQILLISPLVYVAMICSLAAGVRHWLATKEESILVCLAFSLPVLLYFTYLSFRTNVYGNWSAFGYLTALIWTVEEVSRRLRDPKIPWRSQPLFWRWAIGLAVASVILPLAHGAIGWIPTRWESVFKKDRIVQEFYGWPELGGRVGQLRQAGQLIMGLRYQVCAELEFHVPGQPRVYCMNAFGRGNQYDFIDDYNSLQGKNILVVAASPIPAQLAEKFHEIRGPYPVDISYRGVVVKSFLVYDGQYFDDNRGRSLAGRKYVR